MPDAYQEALSFLYNRLNYERTGMPRIPAELRLGRMRRLLRRLGDPQDALKIVHVAGTKGKGSTAAMIASALSASGVVTGLFCSPHLHRLEERFRVDGSEATPEDLISLVDAVRPAVEHFDSDITHHRHRGPTFFEITTAMGLIHFARRKAGAVLLEVGLGGRLDSTNCVRPQVAALLTSISHDHTKQLGTTLGAIAGEKAGILKRGGVAVSGVGPGEARDAIRRVARARHSRASIEIDEDFHYECLLTSSSAREADSMPGPRRDFPANLGSDRPAAARPAPGPQRGRRHRHARRAGGSRVRRLSERRGAGLGDPGLARAGGSIQGLAIDRDRRRPQRRVGGSLGRDVACLLPRSTPYTRLRHDSRKRHAGATASVATHVRSRDRNAIPGEPPIRPARGNRHPHRRQAGTNLGVATRGARSREAVDARNRDHRRDGLAVPRGRIAGVPAGRAKVTERKSDAGLITEITEGHRENTRNARCSKRTDRD